MKKFLQMRIRIARVTSAWTFYEKVVVFCSGEIYISLLRIIFLIRIVGLHIFLTRSRKVLSHIRVASYRTSSFASMYPHSMFHFDLYEKVPRISYKAKAVCTEKNDSIHRYKIYKSGFRYVFR